jgi:hypothetical protein
MREDETKNSGCSDHDHDHDHGHDHGHYESHDHRPGFRE